MDAFSSGHRPPQDAFYLTLLSDTPGTCFDFSYERCYKVPFMLFSADLSVCLGDALGYTNTNYSFKTKLCDPIFLEGTWVCGVAEAILPALPLPSSIPALSLVLDRSGSTSTGRSPSGNHADARESEPTGVPLSPRAGDRKAATAQDPAQKPAQDRAEPSPPNSSTPQPPTTEPESPRSVAIGLGSGELPSLNRHAGEAGAGGPGEGNISPPRTPLLPPSLPVGIFVKIPIGAHGPEGSICEVLSHTFKENLVNKEQAQEILEQIRALRIPKFILNVIFEEEESALLKLADGSTRAYSWEHDSRLTPLEWLANLLTFAVSDEEAGQWIREAEGCWKSLLDARAPQGRKRRAYPYQVSGPGRGWKGRGAGEEEDSLSLIFLYCDIIQGALISDSKERCVRVIPVGPRNLYHSLFPVHYFVCDRNIVEFVHIELRTRGNTYVKFQDPKQPTVVTLHFRRIG